MVITKSAQNLEPGDILAETRDRPRRVLLGKQPSPGGYLLHTAALGIPVGGMNAPSIPEVVVIAAVEAPDLTPAQEQADKLLQLLRDAIADNGGQTPVWAISGQLLIDKIDPPKPPTAEELAAALALVMSGPSTDEQQNGWAKKMTEIRTGILQRARKTGLLK